MPEKTQKRTDEGFSFRLKMGDYEIEIKGDHDDVLRTIKDLPELTADIDTALAKIKPKKVATLTVKTEASAAPKKVSSEYPQILESEKLDETVLKLLETEWGKWRPRTIDEMREALKASSCEPPVRTLATVLMDLVKREKIRRWNTNHGYVYILAEKETIKQRGESD